VNRRLWIPVLALVFLAILPDVAHACPVCFDPRDENRVAFLATTIFLSAVPLGMVGGLTMWLRKRARELQGLDGDEGAASGE
jgi:hypothetical protein